MSTLRKRALILLLSLLLALSPCLALATSEEALWE